MEKLNRSGVNCVKYEQNSASGGGNSSNNKGNSTQQQQQHDRLFTAGRDAIIRAYTNLVPSTATTVSSSSSSSSSSMVRSADVITVESMPQASNTSANSSTASADKFYQMSFSHHSDWVNDIVVCKSSKTCKRNQKKRKEKKLNNITKNLNSIN